MRGKKRKTKTNSRRNEYILNKKKLLLEKYKEILDLNIFIS